MVITMGFEGDELLIGVFTLQALVNLASFGAGLGLMVMPLLRSLQPGFIYLEPGFVFIYPLLAVFALWFLSREGNLGKKISYIYFAIGILGSLVALADQLSYPGGLDELSVVIVLFWLLTSTAGLFLVREVGDIPTLWTFPAMALFMLSAFLGFGLSYMVAEDYYYHAIIPEPPKNANVTSAKPVEVPPPNLTSASG